MTALIVGLLMAVPPEATQKLAGCLERKDRVCLTALLSRDGDRSSAEYLALAARAYVLLGRPKDALNAIGQALQLQPGSYDYLMEQGWIYQKAGDQMGAIHSFLLAAKAQPGTAATFYELGMSFFLLDEYQRARTHFERVLELEPKDDRAEFMLGVLDIMTQHEPDAKGRFETALALQPRNPHYLLHYGVLLNKLGETDKGIEFMREAEALDAANPLTHYNLGRAYLNQGKLTVAREELERSIKLRPTLAPAFYKLSAVYRELGNPEKAREMMKRYGELERQQKEEDDDPGNSALVKQ